MPGSQSFTYEDSLEAERLFRTAIEHDLGYALAHAELGAAFAIRMENSWTVLTRADEERALFCANEAVRLDPELWGTMRWATQCSGD